MIVIRNGGGCRGVATLSIKTIRINRNRKMKYAKKLMGTSGEALAIIYPVFNVNN